MRSVVRLLNVDMSASCCAIRRSLAIFFFAIETWILTGVLRFSHNKVSCKRPCNRKLACGHGCSEDCSEQCRCGKRCNYVAKPRKRNNANFVSLDKFLGSDEDEEEAQADQMKVPLAVVAQDVVQDAAQDLISIWGDEDIVPSGNNAVVQVESRSASPDSADCQDLSELASEKDLDMSRAGSEATTRDSGVINASPASPPCPTGCASEKSLPASRVSDGTGSIHRQAVVSQGSRSSDQVINETFREVRIKNGFRREEVAVHRSKSVHVLQADKIADGPRRMDSPEPPKVPIKAPQSPPADDNLIDLSDPPVETPTGVEAEVPRDFTQGIGFSLQHDLLELVNLRAGIGATVPQEDMRSDTSDLIAF